MSDVTQHSIAMPTAEMSPREEILERASLGVRFVTLVTIIVPLLGVFATPFFVWGWGFGWTDLGLLLGMYLLTSLGITVGFHRLFVHRSFEAYMWVKFIWAIFGSIALQGSLFQWVALHRRHHQHSDTPEDHHSPHHKGNGVLGLLRVFWHAHIGWLFEADPPRLERYIADLSASRTLRSVNLLFPLWVALGFVIPAVLGGFLTSSWGGFWTGLVWAD